MSDLKSEVLSCTEVEEFHDEEVWVFFAAYSKVGHVRVLRAAGAGNPIP